MSHVFLSKAGHIMKLHFVELDRFHPKMVFHRKETESVLYLLKYIPVKWLSHLPSYKISLNEKK